MAVSWARPVVGSEGGDGSGSSRGVLEPEAEAGPHGASPQGRKAGPGCLHPPVTPRSAGRLPLQHCGLWLDRLRLHSRGLEVRPPRAGEVCFPHHTHPARAALRCRQRGEAAVRAGSSGPISTASVLCPCLHVPWDLSQPTLGAKTVSQRGTSPQHLCPANRGSWLGVSRASVLGQRDGRVCALRVALACSPASWRLTGRPLPRPLWEVWLSAQCLEHRVSPFSQHAAEPAWFRGLHALHLGTCMCWAVSPEVS